MEAVPTTAAQTSWGSVSDAPGLDESRFAHDDKLYITFYRAPVLHNGKSTEAGRAIYEERDFIKIMVPGDKLTVVDREVDEIDRRRFADRYAKWKAGQGNVVEGTPLTSLPRMSASKAQELKYFNIHTVEQLAAAPDALGQKFMGFFEDKRRAQQFLDVAKGNAPIEKMNEELKARDARIEELQAQVEAITKAMKDRKPEK